MAKVTNIEWTATRHPDGTVTPGATWNPWIGCHKVSQGCAHCYAERLVNGRMGGKFSVVRRAAPATFNAPLRWKEPARVFTASLSDFFIEEADEWRDDAWSIIRGTPHLTYQILTKRPERILECLPRDWNVDGLRFTPYKNVWLGTSVEDDATTRERIPKLIEVPATKRFLSCEPLLGYLPPFFMLPLLAYIDWVIVGGESGPSARPMDLGWVRSIRDVCREMEVPFFFKQLGGPAGEKGDHEDAVLDGRLWKEMPA
jgi:protein gp37